MPITAAILHLTSWKKRDGGATHDVQNSKCPMQRRQRGPYVFFRNRVSSRWGLGESRSLLGYPPPRDGKRLRQSRQFAPSLYMSMN